MNRESKAAWLIWAALMLVGVLRIVDTYDFNSVTNDEPFQISAGIEWLAEGRYTYEPQHPPLARVAAALGPFADQHADFRALSFARDAWAIVYYRDNPIRNLTLARLGILPFFVVAGLFVFLWARECGGLVAGFIATFLFTTAPPVLTHAGLATTDMALACTAPMALYLYLRALNANTLRTWLIFGLAVGLALLSKMSALLFLGACITGLTIHVLIKRNREALPIRSYLRGRFFPLMAAAAMAFLVLWAGYQFSVAYTFLRIPVPAPEFFRGVQDVIAHGREGHRAYLLGETSQFGWWYFFPVAVGVKTPLPMLILLFPGIAAATIALPGSRREAKISVLLCGALTLLVLLPSPVNIGVRYVLPLYFFLAIIGGFGAAWLLRRKPNRAVAWTVIGGLLLWQGAASVAAHPDYIPYFNEFAALTDDPILVDSDRDWGQTLYRLQDYVAAHEIEQIHVALLGLNEEHLRALGIPAFVMLEPEIRSGWIAVSAYMLHVMEGQRWLRDYTPVETIGDSVYVYHLNGEEARE